MLAPHRIPPIFLPLILCSATYFLIAATDIAPAGSAITRVSSKISLIAEHISSLVTVITPSSNLSHRRNVSVPIVFTATPSAKIPTEGRVTISPASMAALKQADSSDSTPMILMSGFSCFRYTAIPAARPPPPIATNRISRLGFCSSSSRATVPWPAITSGSSNGGIKV